MLVIKFALPSPPTPETEHEQINLGGLIPRTHRTLRDRGEVVLLSKEQVEHYEVWLDTRDLGQVRLSATPLSECPLNPLSFGSFTAAESGGCLRWRSPLVD